MQVAVARNAGVGAGWRDKRDPATWARGWTLAVLVVESGWLVDLLHNACADDTDNAKQTKTDGGSSNDRLQRKKIK